MWMDAVDLRDFYASATGQMARRMVRRRIRDLWPDARGLNVLGLGYATPYLSPFRAEAQRVAAVMPAAQGVLHWPLEGRSLTCLADDADLPLPDLSMDRILLVHALECSEQVRPMMREVWRVLAGNGRLLVVVPNRSGLWARLERTPLGHGRPYSTGQLTRLLRDCLFTPTRTDAALFAPPTTSRMVRSSSLAIENIGHRWFKGFAGVIMVEATKQLYGVNTEAEAKRRKAYLPLPRRNHPAPTPGVRRDG
ncbi:MAG: methyltransferase domain-containing protein [Hyphomicrobiales bacterium]|nr:methyltransferase domain-containing protein [Hyphomicrobiales bacterium]MCP5372215.1 methyltransferase domain-containing protein [Hyphomicrobiales bacterium]